jgi:hypothetical protein
MKIDLRILKPVLPALAVVILAAGCGDRKPVTVVFTGDTQGRLVPAG